jgi:AAA domain
MSQRLICAADRIAEFRGPKILVVGAPGVGKTTLLTTVAPGTLASTLFVDAEAGDIAIGDLEVASVRPRTWGDCRDIACAIGGPNPALSANAAYSDAHYRTVVADDTLAGFANYTMLFVDSLTEISRQCRVWAEQQPESYTDRGKKDLRAVYGLVARELIGWLQQMQHARGRTVVLIAVLERVTDDYGVSSLRIQLEGQATARQLPAIVDEVVTMTFVDFGDAKPVRALVCTHPNSQGVPAKDRSGKLEEFEPPHLGQLLAKLSNRETRQT